MIQGASLIQEPSPGGGGIGGASIVSGVDPPIHHQPHEPHHQEHSPPEQMVQLEDMGPEPYGDVFTGKSVWKRKLLRKKKI